MKTGESIAIATVRLFEAGDLSFLLNPERARQIFVSACSNRLTVALAMTCAIFTNIHQKFDQRRISLFYEARP